MAQKIPPPILLTGPEYEGFNRWLLELTSILSNEGGITPDEVTGLPAVITQVGTNTANITALQGTTGGQGSAITILQGEISIINGEIATINGQLTTLGARAQVLNGVGVPGAGLGNDNDWYGNRGGAAGARIYIKVAGAWVPFPF